MQLETAIFDGGVSSPLGVTRQLMLPAVLDAMKLTISHTTVEDISQTLGSYIRDYFRRDARFQGKLRVSSAACGVISISVNAIPSPITLPAHALPSVVVTVDLPPQDALEE